MVSNMKSRDKRSVLEKIALHLSKFYPELTNIFICPTCLQHIDITNSIDISVAHITPDSAGGWQKTFLCTKCNNNFGSRQDRWFGDHIKMIKENKHPIESNTLRKFYIDGVRYGGKILVDNEKGINICVNLEFSAPDALDKLLLMKKRGGPHALRAPLPILSKENEIDVGYLTAAYLAWFDALGYSWALQDHLSVVRDQILNPTKNTIDGKYVFSQGNDFSFINGAAPTVIYKAGVYMPAVVVAKSIVILPTPDISLAKFHELNEGKEDEIPEYRFLTAKKDTGWGKPMSMTYDGKLFIWPDCALKNPGSADHLFYRDFDSDPIQLWPKRKKHSGVEDHAHGKHVTAPRTETARKANKKIDD
jgi:hypothetical protein